MYRASHGANPSFDGVRHNGSCLLLEVTFPLGLGDPAVPNSVLKAHGQRLRLMRMVTRRVIRMGTRIGLGFGIADSNLSPQGTAENVGK